MHRRKPCRSFGPVSANTESQGFPLPRRFCVCVARSSTVLGLTGEFYSLISLPLDLDFGSLRLSMLGALFVSHKVVGARLVAWGYFDEIIFDYLACLGFGIAYTHASTKYCSYQTSYVYF